MNLQEWLVRNKNNYYITIRWYDGKWRNVIKLNDINNGLKFLEADKEIYKAQRKERYKNHNTNLNTAVKNFRGFKPSSDGQNKWFIVDIEKEEIFNNENEIIINSRKQIMDAEWHIRNLMKHPRTFDKKEFLQKQIKIDKKSRIAEIPTNTIIERLIKVQIVNDKK